MRMNMTPQCLPLILTKVYCADIGNYRVRDTERIRHLKMRGLG